MKNMSPRDYLDLVKKHYVAAVAVFTALCLLFIYTALFVPALARLRSKNAECLRAEAKAGDARLLIEQAKKSYVERILVNEDSIPYVMDELTRCGNANGVNFIAINPGEAGKDAASGYVILPIRMRLSAGYQDAGAFLGSLDELDKGLVKMKSFDIRPQGPDASKLEIDLQVDIYLSGK